MSYQQDESYTRRLAPSQEQDEWWAHWLYDKEEWQRFDQAEWQNAQKQARRALNSAILVSLPVAGVVGFAGWRSMGASVLAILLLFLVLLLSSSYLNFVATIDKARQRHNARQNGLREIWLGPTQIYESGEIIDLVGKGWRIYWVMALKQKRQLRFTLALGRAAKEIYIPIPAGHEDEATQLARRYTRQVIPQQPRIWRPAPPTYAAPQTSGAITQRLDGLASLNLGPRATLQPPDSGYDTQKFPG